MSSAAVAVDYDEEKCNRDFYDDRLSVQAISLVDDAVVRTFSMSVVDVVVVNAVIA